MSRARISTGDIVFNTAIKADDSLGTPRSDQAPMHIAIIGDFSGRSSYSEAETRSIAKQRAIAIDRDNFDEVFTALDVKLQLPLTEGPISFREFDELHPDYLVENVELFDNFRRLKRSLKKPEHFQNAMEEIQQWHPSTETQPTAKGQQSDDTSTQSDNILDNILSQNQHFSQSCRANTVDQLIKSIIAPHVEVKADPRQAEMETIVDHAMAETLRKIMHASQFQSLESNWHMLNFLVRRLETNSRLKLFILDITREEIEQDLDSYDEFNQTELYAHFVNKAQTPGNIPFSILQWNYEIQDTSRDIRLASAMAAIAHANNAIALANAHEKLAGCQDLSTYEDAADWQYDEAQTMAINHWQTLRQQNISKHLALTAPKFLLRLPYGKKSSPIEHFPFEELTKENPHREYLWGNSAALVTLLLAQSYQQFGWQHTPGPLNEVANLPLHIYTDDDGESCAKAIAEYYLTDGAAEKLADAGLLSIRSIKGRDAVIVSSFRSSHISGELIFSQEVKHA